MKHTALLLIALSFGLLSSCTGRRAAKTHTDFGEALTLSQVTPFKDILATPAKFTDAPVLTEAHVRKVCTKKGCWMELAQSLDEKNTGCRVTFKDYSFFVPTTSIGALAKVQGALAVESISAEEVKHYEGEGGSFPHKAPDGSAQTLSLIATGVTLKPSQTP
jgi:hypothetical protein